MRYVKLNSTNPKWIKAKLFKITKNIVQFPIQHQLYPFLVHPAKQFAKNSLLYQSMPIKYLETRVCPNIVSLGEIWPSLKQYQFEQVGELKTRTLKLQGVVQEVQAFILIPVTENWYGGPKIWGQPSASAGCFRQELLSYGG